MIQYVDVNRQNSTFTPGASTPKQDMINNIETVLLAAGWTTISGHATTTLVMQSATTPGSLAMQIKVKDNGGTCVTVSIQNVSGSKVGNNSTTSGAQLNPGTGSKTYRMIANKYQAFIFTPAPTPAREFAAWGVPSLPSWLVGTITECMWLTSNSQSDTGTSIMTTFRTFLQAVKYGTGLWGNTQLLLNGNLWEVANNGGTSGLGPLRLVPPGGTYDSTNGLACASWHDGSANLVDALLAWGLTGQGDPCLIRAQLWDAMVGSQGVSGDLTTTADSHNWIAITDGNTGTSPNSPGCLFLAIP